MNRIDELASEAERLTAERDDWKRRAEAAEKDMLTYIDRNIKGTSGKFACDLCKYRGLYEKMEKIKCPKGCDGINKWKWRGPGAENANPSEIPTP